MKRPELAELISLAAAAHGNNRSELARLVGCTPQRLWQWESGLVACPPAKVALIAAAGNLPADQWLTRATLWKYEGTEDGARLQKALGKSMRAIGAALVLCIAVALGASFDDGQGGRFSPA